MLCGAVGGAVDSIIAFMNGQQILQSASDASSTLTELFDYPTVLSA